MTEICEHDRKIDNDERQHVELDRKNKKYCHNDEPLRVTMTEK